MSAWADAVTQADIQVLYRRFQTLDRRKKGYISMDEFLNIPELSINPLSQRLVTLFENVNFEDFVKLIAVFTDKASKEEKLRVIFSSSGTWTGASGSPAATTPSLNRR